MDRSAPQIRISVLADEKATSGEPSTLLAGRVLSFAFEDGDEKADKLTLTIRNDDLALFEQGEDVLGGTVLEVSWGYPGAMAPPRRMIVKSIKGSLVLTVEALDFSIQLHRETRARGWQGLTRTEVVREIAKEYGCEGAFADVQETTESYDTISQVGETDASLLARLARLEGFHFWIDDLGFHWKERPLDVAPTHVLTYQIGGGPGGSILEWSPESDLVRRVGKTKIVGRDPIEKKDIVEEASATSDSERTTLGDVLEVVDPETGATHLETRNATSATRGSSVSTSARASAEAKARFRRAERETVKLSLRVFGDPTLRAKELVEIRGISTLFSGLYYLKAVKHVIGDGYVCEVSAIRDSKGALARGVQAKAQGGQKNTSKAKRPGEIETFERVDAETGGTQIEYHRGGQVIGVEDPEAMESR